MNRVAGIALGIVGAALIGAVAMKPLASPGFAEREVDAPPLGGLTKDCSGDRGVAEHRAREALRGARARAQRFQFDLRDGVVALGLYRESIACFAAAGSPENGVHLEPELAKWAGQLNEVYAALRLRLRVSLDQGRDEEALDAANELDALLAGSPSGPYRSWLDGLRRELEQREAKKRS